jgi:hypothetical protein
MNRVSHPSDAELEAYVLRTMPEADVGPLHMHLLICHCCRKHLSESKKLVIAMRVADEDHHFMHPRR